MSTVALPRWVVFLLVGACVASVIGVAFLLGRVTAPSPAVTVTSAAVAEPLASGGAEAAREAPPAGPGAFPTPEAALSGIPRETPGAFVPEGGDATGRGSAPAAGHADAAAVAAYFTQMDGVAAQVKAAQDPEALARTILEQTLSGNMTGFDDLIATQRALQARMTQVQPPGSCREHHERSLRLMGRAIALLERTRGAVAGRNTADIANVATEGHAIEEEARATDALANDIRRAAGLPVVP